MAKKKMLGNRGLILTTHKYVNLSTHFIGHTQVCSVQEEEPANEGIGLRDGGDIMGRMHSSLAFFLFISLFSFSHNTDHCLYTHSVECHISYSHLPLFIIPHVYSLAWHPSISQLKYSFSLVNRWVPSLYPFLFTTSNILSFSLVNSCL